MLILCEKLLVFIMACELDCEDLEVSFQNMYMHGKCLYRQEL
jgi:hypothetical protein